MFQNWLAQGLKYLETHITFHKETAEKRCSSSFLFQTTGNLEEWWWRQSLVKKYPTYLFLIIRECFDLVSCYWLWHITENACILDVWCQKSLGGLFGMSLVWMDRSTTKKPADGNNHTSSEPLLKLLSKAPQVFFFTLWGFGILTPDLKW